MLVKFTFKNYKSFLDEQVLSMEAGPGKEMESTLLDVGRELIPQGGTLLASAAIFGAAASGKTNVLRALDYMKRVVLVSSGRVQIVRQVDPFAFQMGAQELDSHFEVEIIQDSTYYRYGFVIRGQRIVREWLFRRTERLTPLFQRDEEGLRIKGLAKNQARLLTPPSSTLFLTVAAEVGAGIGKEVSDVIEWFSKLTISFGPSQDDLKAFSGNEELLHQAMEVVAKAGCGICGMKLIEDGSYIDIETSHPVYDKEGQIARVRNVRLFQDRGLLSDGTVRLICTLALVMKAIEQGSVLLVDDFTAIGELFIPAHILSLFTSGLNIKRAQLIVTSSSPGLAGKALRRDQVWFTSRAQGDQTQLMRLSSITGVRKGGSYEKRLLEAAWKEED